MYSMTSHLPLRSIRFFLHVLAKFAVNERDEFGHAFWFYFKNHETRNYGVNLIFLIKNVREGRSDLDDTTAYLLMWEIAWLLMWEMPDYHGSCSWNKKQKGRITANCGWKAVTSVYIWSPIPLFLSRLDKDRIGINKARMVHANFGNDPWKLCMNHFCFIYPNPVLVWSGGENGKGGNRADVKVKSIRHIGDILRCAGFFNAKAIIMKTG